MKVLLPLFGKTRNDPESVTWHPCLRLDPGSRVQFGPVIPILGVGICACLIAISTAEKLLLGTGVLVIGAFLYLFMRWKYGEAEVGPEAVESVSD